jgi:hypothetical protein
MPKMLETMPMMIIVETSATMGQTGAPSTTTTARSQE